MADAFSHSTLRRFQVKWKRWDERPPVGTTQYTTQNIDHRAQTVAFMASVFAVDTERKNGSPIDHLYRVDGRPPLAVDDPPSGHGLGFTNGVLNFSVRGRTRRQIDDDWRLLIT